MDLPFDAATRKRVYLLRHAEAGYFDSAGKRIPDGRTALLTEKGEEEARNVGHALSAVDFDKAVCSGLPRTVATARLVLGPRKLDLEINEAFQELRGNMAASVNVMEPHDIAYTMFKAVHPDATFYGGERFDDFFTRVTKSFERLIATPFHNLLLVCHGGTNRAILSWALGTGLRSFGHFEQDSGCVNIIDLDIAHQGEPDEGVCRRIIFRGLNMLPGDIAKHETRLTTLEGMTERTLKSLGKKQD